MDEELKNELRELYPTLAEDELEEAARNVEEYAKALAEMYLRIHREKIIKLREKKFDSPMGSGNS